MIMFNRKHEMHNLENKTVRLLDRDDKVNMNMKKEMKYKKS